jgi:hypothetical protein
MTMLDFGVRHGILQHPTCAHDGATRNGYMCRHAEQEAGGPCKSAPLKPVWPTELRLVYAMGIPLDSTSRGTLTSPWPTLCFTKSVTLEDCSAKWQPHYNPIADCWLPHLGKYVKEGDLATTVSLAERSGFRVVDGPPRFAEARPPCWRNRKKHPLRGTRKPPRRFPLYLSA